MSSSLWNYTINNVSPVLVYNPYSDGPSTAGWTMSNGLEGSTLHRTADSDASMTLRFNGTAVYLYGQASMAYSVILDGSTSTLSSAPSSMLLFEKDNLTDDLHTLVFTGVHSDTGHLAVESAVITKSWSNLSTTVLHQNSTALAYTGNWSTTNEASSPTDVPQKFTDQKGASVSTTFSGAMAVAVNGTTGPGTYSIIIDGESTSFNGSSYMSVSDNVLYFQDNLDSTLNHTVTITNTASQDFWLSSISLYLGSKASAGGSSSLSAAASSSTSSQTSRALVTTRKKTNPGIIIGPIIAILALASLVGAFFLWRRRHHPIPESRSTVDLSYLDLGKEVEVTPFPSELRNSRRQTVAGLQEPEAFREKHSSYSSDSPPPVPMKSPQRLGSFNRHWTTSPLPLRTSVSTPPAAQSPPPNPHSSMQQIIGKPIVTTTTFTEVNQYTPRARKASVASDLSSPPHSPRSPSFSSPIYLPTASSSPPTDSWPGPAPRNGIRPLPVPPRRKAVPSYIAESDSS